MLIASSAVMVRNLRQRRFMSDTRSRARVRWASRKRSLRRRWKLYLILILAIVTSAAIVVIIINNVDEPDNGKKAATPVPTAIR